MVGDWPSAGLEVFAGALLLGSLPEMHALSMGWREGDSALLGGKSFIKEREMSDNPDRNSGHFFPSIRTQCLWVK